ncbi:MFS transporter [Micromonospora craterilacus]|uniref:MFS transporter n=1 Tax=Micromonospora craterilacus TaxID=1655439 RepID=A0A2W2F4D3_9ACTN|nr:MFS transporter [Micromonospora craterilacus]
MPGGYWAWLGGTGLSLVGVQAMAFAMAWVAAGQGGRFAALVLTAINLPRVLLLLVGGAVADRFGAWRVMILSDAAMVVVTVSLAVAAWSAADPRLPLLLTALAIGIVDAFYLPSAGSMPRRLVPPAALARAMSARQVAGQLAVFAGPPLGSLVLAAAGLAGVALANAAGFLAVLSILVVLRPRAGGSSGSGEGRSSDPGAGRASDAGEGRTADPVPSVWRAALDGLRVAASHAALRPALLLTGVAAGFLLPASSLLVPLLARERAWSPPATGAVVAAVALGTASVAVTVLVRGALSRPGLAAAAGLLMAAAGVAALAVGRSPLWAGAAGAAIGLGSGVFATHIGPLILAAAPATHLARVQSVLVLTQSLPLLLTTNAFGWLADVVRAPAVLSGCAVVLAVAALAALTSPALRQRST